VTQLTRAAAVILLLYPPTDWRHSYYVTE